MTDDEKTMGDVLASGERLPGEVSRTFYEADDDYVSTNCDIGYHERCPGGSCQCACHRT